MDFLGMEKKQTCSAAISLVVSNAERLTAISCPQVLLPH